MKEFILNILNVIGLGVNAQMPTNLGLFIGRMKEFVPKHEIVCTDDTEGLRTLQFISENGSFAITYYLDGRRVDRMDIKEL